MLEIDSQVVSIFMLSGSTSVKAVCRMLMKLSPGQRAVRVHRQVVNMSFQRI